MPVAKGRWIVEPGLAFPQLMERYSKTIFLAGRRVAEDRAKKLEQWAKDNASWTDRTGDARKLLKAEALDSPGVLTEIELRHGVPYGVWLELVHGGKNAIIAKAIDAQAPLFMRDIQNMMNLKIIAK